MRMVCISKSNDIAVGLRLAGVQSFFIKDNDEIDLKQCIAGGFDKVYEIAKFQIQKISNNQELPLIVTIPNS